MDRGIGIQVLLLATAMIVVVPLSVGCQATAPSAVTGVPATLTVSEPAGTPTATAPAATETKPAVDTATVPGQETQAPAAATDAPIAPVAGSEAAVAAAVADLTQRLAIDEQEILVQVVEAVDWSDASLGCPQPGMMYAQAITSGFRVVFEVDGKIYDYHTDRRGSAILCEE